MCLAVRRHGLHGMSDVYILKLKKLLSQYACAEKLVSCETEMRLLLHGSTDRDAMHVIYTPRLFYVFSFAYCMNTVFPMMKSYFLAELSQRNIVI